jgi:hypothetical protein
MAAFLRDWRFFVLGGTARNHLQAMFHLTVLPETPFEHVLEQAHRTAVNAENYIQTHTSMCGVIAANCLRRSDCMWRWW